MDELAREGSIHQLTAKVFRTGLGKDLPLGTRATLLKNGKRRPNACRSSCCREVWPHDDAILQVCIATFSPSVGEGATVGYAAENALRLQSHVTGTGDRSAARAPVRCSTR